MTVLKQTEDEDDSTVANAQQQAQAAKPQPVAQPNVSSQMPSRARQVLSSAQNYYSSVAPTSRPQATEDVRRRGSIQQAPSNRYYQTLERFKKPERKDFQEEGKEVDEEAYQQAMDTRTQSMREFAGQERQDYEAWFNEQMKNNPQILDQRDKRMATPNQKRLRSLGRGLSSVTGMSLPRGIKRKFGTDRVSEMKGSAKNLAMFREQQGEKVAPLTDDGKVNPDFKEEQQATLDENKTTVDEAPPAPPKPAPAPQPANQTTLGDFPSKEPELPQASRDVLRKPTGTLSDFGMTFTDGSEESPAAKAAREAREKAQAKQGVRPKTEQSRLGRNLKGQRLPGYGKMPKGKLSDFRLDDEQGYREFKDGGEGNVAEHDRRLEEQRKKKLEESATGRQTTLESSVEEARKIREKELEARGAREKKLLDSMDRAGDKKTVQTKLGRNVEGEFLSGYGGRSSVAATTNLERTQEREKALADSRKKESNSKQTKLGRNVKGLWEKGFGGKDNVAAVTNLERTKNFREGMADKRKKQKESTSSKQTGLGDY